MPIVSLAAAYRFQPWELSGSLFGLFGLYEKWWRYFQLPDLWPIIRAAGSGSTRLLVVTHTISSGARSRIGAMARS